MPRARSRRLGRADPPTQQKPTQEETPCEGIGAAGFRGALLAWILQSGWGGLGDSQDRGLLGVGDCALWLGDKEIVGRYRTYMQRVDCSKTCVCFTL